jgi:hypothetical protein
MESPSDITCAACRRVRERPMARNGSRRIPAGWKCLEGQWWCVACTRERFVLRAVALPVSGPVDGTWAELREALHTAFAETTRCANWLVTEFYARDAKREPADGRLRAMPRVYLYPEARLRFPALASQTLASLERQVLARYRAARLDLVWRHAASLPTWRYPMPLPVPARMWTLERHAQRWCLSVRLGDRRWLLRLRHGPGMGRQLRLLDRVAAGDIDAGEATLYEMAAHRSDHRSESAPERRLMVKIVVWLPRRVRATPASADLDHRRPDRATAIISTSAEAFLAVRLAHETDRGRRDTWTQRGEQVRRWLAEAKPRDRSAGLASTPPIVARRRAARLRRSLDDWTHRVGAHVIAWAGRRGVTTLVWDDRSPASAPAFPWRRFVRTLTDKAQLAGIEVAIAPDGSSDGEPLIDGHPQAEAGARPGTPAGRDRSQERVKAPEIAGRSSRRLRDDRRERRAALSIAGGRSSQREARTSTTDVQ